MRNQKPFSYREVASERWTSSLLRQLRELDEERRNPPQPIKVTAEPDLEALDRLVEGPTSFASLRRQIQEFRAEAANPTRRAEITAQADPHALEGLIDTQSPFLSIYLQARTILAEIRNPQPVETTAEPVEVEPLWSEWKVKKPVAVSLGAHVFMIMLVFTGFWSSSDPFPVQTTETFIPLYLPPNLLLPEEDDTSGGGGGGGRNRLTAPSLGQPPRASDQQLVPPTPEPPSNSDPFLVAEPTIVAPQLASMFSYVDLLNLGDPDSIPAPPSSGPGTGGGIGAGQGRGVGTGGGPGLGPGEGGGYGGGVFRVGGGITPPTILFKRDPIYSEEARKAQYQGTVVLEAIVRKDGSVEILRVVRSVGFGLDENAIKALKEWKFKPGMRNGVPVDVALNIEVNFNLR